ncbi:MAG: hypothetical protein DWP98_04755 [Bacteroidetes bacterium]|nr:MAG: hypothetical protein DWP98_04755 [Bacteroidota bacterium]MBL1144631.1 hypothetical protein [Bacteroidota bacterium]NOG57426.1 hypothetical protein [Bacteroidota bacterium]
MLFEAGYISLIRTILIFIGIYYAFKFIFRFLVPIILQRFIKKQASKFSNNNTSNSNYRTGEVHIKTPPKNHANLKDLGDYVPYEEVEENKEK